MPAFGVHLVFYMLWEDIRITKLIPWEFLHLTFFLCLTCFEMISAQPFWFPGSVCIMIWRSSYVLHGLRGLQDNKGDSVWVPAFEVSLVFYTPCQTVLLCFTRLEKTSGQTNWFPRSACIWCFSHVLQALGKYQHNNVDSLDMPAFDVLLHFTCLGSISEQLSWFPGSARIWQFSCVSLVFQVPCLRLACFFSFLSLGSFMGYYVSQSFGRRSRQKVNPSPPAEG